MINDPPRVIRKRAPASAICSTIPSGVLTLGFGVLGLPISLPSNAKVFFAKLFFVGLSFSLYLRSSRSWFYSFGHRSHRLSRSIWLLLFNFPFSLLGPTRFLGGADFRPGSGR